MGADSMRALVWVGAVALASAATFLAACGGEASSGASSAAASASPAPGGPPPTERSCSAYGGKGAGTFQEMCRVKKAGAVATWTGQYEKSRGGDDEAAMIDVKNETGMPLTWATLSVWCYGKDDALLEFSSQMDTSKFKRWYRTGSGVLRDKSGKALAPGATVRTEGPGKKSMPADPASCVAEVTAWGMEEDKEKLYFAFDRDIPNIDMRPKAGF
jgi:hypothetical protein